MKILRQIEELIKEKELNMNEASQELSSLKIKKDELINIVNGSRSRLKTKFNIKDKANVLKAEKDLKEIQDEINVVEKIMLEMGKERINTTTDEVINQFAEHIENKYNHLEKIKNVENNINELLKSIDDLKSITPEIRRESYEVKKLLNNHTNIPGQNDSWDRMYNGIRLGVNVKELYGLLDAPNVKYSLRDIHSTLSGIASEMNSF